jgi:hypothetical protein
VKRLSSLSLTLWSLGATGLFLVAGMVLAQAPPFARAMAGMNQVLVWDWLWASAGGGAARGLVALWFLGLCGAVGLLVANLAACTWTRLLPRLRAGARLHSWLLLLAHVLMILILLGHLSQMILGFKQEGIRLLPGQARELPGGLHLAVEEVRFVDDPGLLNLPYRRARRAHTTEVIHPRRNLARVVLSRPGGGRARAELRLMEPWSAGSLRLTLSEFFRAGPAASPRVGAVLTAVRNPFTGLFFAAYLAWIAVYLLLTLQAFGRKSPPWAG